MVQFFHLLHTDNWQQTNNQVFEVPKSNLSYSLSPASTQLHVIRGRKRHSIKQSITVIEHGTVTLFQSALFYITSLLIFNCLLVTVCVSGHSGLWIQLLSHLGAVVRSCRSETNILCRIVINNKYRRTLKRLICSIMGDMFKLKHDVWVTS